MSARLLLFSRKQDKLLWFLKHSLASSPTTKTLVPFSSSSSSSFFRSLSTVPYTEEPLISFVRRPPLIDTNISQQTEQRDSDDDDWYDVEYRYSDGYEDDDNSYYDDDYDEKMWEIMYRREEDIDYHYWDAEKLIKLFSSTKPPRIPYIFPNFSQKKKTYFDTDIFNHILRRLYKCGQDNYAKELLDEILDYKEGLYLGTKALVFNEWKKRVKPGEPVDGKYMVDAVSKICYGHPPVETLNQLLIKLSRCHHAETALDLVYLVGCNQSIEVMDALLNGLGREEKVDKMNKLLHNMIEVEGNFSFAYNESSFRIVVYHLCRLQRVDEALQVLNSFKPPDLIVNNMITKALCKVGRQEEGLALVDRMRSHVGCAPDIVTYNALIDGFCKAGEIETSWKLFDKMNEGRVSADVTTLNTLVAGMCKDDNVSCAFDFFMDMRRKGLKGNATTYTSLITGFCNARNLDKAMDLFNEMGSTLETLPNIAIYNVIIDSLCKEKRTEDALFFMDKMNVKGLFPNVVTYNTIFRGLRDINSLNEAFKLMDSMKGQACHPNDETMEILSDWLSAEGETTRLQTLISSV